jgi:hypothetical protein
MVKKSTMDIRELRNLSDDDLLNLLEAVITVLNVRFFLSSLADGCEFNIHIKQPKEGAE